jgi:thymidylate kinase
MAVRQGSVELYEQESKIRRIRENYLRLIPAAQADGEHIAVVEGRGTPAAVAALVWDACTATLPAL